MGRPERNKTLIHCKKQLEWNSIIRIISEDLKPNFWLSFKSKTAIMAEGGYTHIDYVQEDYDIIPASDFIEANTATDGEKLRDQATFKCTDCKKELPFSKRCDPDVDMCTDCMQYYPNLTGHCSAYCRATGICDESC